MEDNLASKIKLKGIIEYIGPFGSGKTTSLEKYFNESKTTLPIWFNAFSYDLSESHKITFINGMIMSIFKALGGKANKEKVIDALKLVQRIFKGTAVSTFESKGITLTRADDAAWEEFVETYEAESNKIEKLRTLLNEMASTTKKDIVIIIDDLDRARLNSALEIIETAKHIFDVPNITIILVYDRRTMDWMFAQKYGRGDEERYLDKYIYETHMHEDASPFKALDNLYFMNGLKSIIDPSARQLAIFDSKYDLKYVAVNGGRSHLFDSDAWFFIKGMMTAIRLSKPELLRLTTTGVTTTFKHPRDLYREVQRGRSQFKSNVNPYFEKTYNEFMESLNGETLIDSLVVGLVEVVNNMPLRTDLD